MVIGGHARRARKPGGHGKRRVQRNMGKGELLYQHVSGRRLDGANRPDRGVTDANCRQSRLELALACIVKSGRIFESPRQTAQGEFSNQNNLPIKT